VVVNTEYVTTEEAARVLGYASTGTARKYLSRLGIRAEYRQPGRAGQSMWSAEIIRGIAKGKKK
jgi:hypothetical protein